MTYKTRKNEDRTRIINLYIEKMPRKEIARILDINVDTVYKIISVYQKEGRIDAIQRGGPKNTTITKGIEEFIIDSLDGDFKNHVRRSQPNNEEELFTAIDEAFLSVLPADCNEYYRNMVSYLVKSLNKEIIID
ncbi:hypothetical protein BB559_002675 [Furculomyces boomerangus]|uniref:Insertion element IS150 protein InsJ-like helix-turn-helix domain-containing protein n=1 Tax=Furculomyces boomerangus TaxID=61424 RepID=A0A2T9YTE7_9FUNG|nr:hypothetical protein BB559_002675 [Furculomyces boomerangus]